MAWFDERVWSHPKFLELSDQSFRTYFHAVGYASGYLTHGHLTERQLALIGATDETRAELETAGFWHCASDGGIDIHDWDEHNGKRDVRRIAERERKKAARSAGTHVRLSAGHGAGQSAGQGAGQKCVEGSEGSDGSEEKESSKSVVDLSIDSGAVRRIYDHWRRVRGKTRSNYEKISPGRRDKIKARLKDSTEEELLAAIDGVARDPWPERPMHDDLTVIFRNREQVDRFLAFAAPNGNGAGPRPTYSDIERDRRDAVNRAILEMP
jgi:hypothetical protein